MSLEQTALFYFGWKIFATKLGDTCVCVYAYMETYINIFTDVRCMYMFDDNPNRTVICSFILVTNPPVLCTVGSSVSSKAV